MTSAGTGYPHPAASSSGRSETVFYAAVAVYLVLTLSLTSSFQYSLYPDATSYLSIAQAYVRGQFWDAVNGYWSPLYCWLLAPLLAAGVGVLLAPKLLALLIGVLTLAGVRRLCRRMGSADPGVTIVLIAVVPSLVCWSLTYVTPDFLLVGVLTWYLSAVVGWSPSSGARAGLAAGALAGIACLSKQYAMPFVVAHLALAGALFYHQYRTRVARAVVRRWLIAAYVVLLAVTGPWIVAMSAKYARPTIATAGTYNWYLGSTGFNVGTRTLAPPPFPGAVSAWVDPTPFAHAAQPRTRPATPVTAADSIVNGLKTAFDRVRIFVVKLERFSLLAVAILAAAGVLALRDARRQGDYRYVNLGLALGLFIGGYEVVSGSLIERLVWIVAILLAVLGALVFQRLATPLQPRARWVGAIVLALSFWPLPALRLAQGLHEGREVHATARRLERYGVQGRLAALNRYADSLRVAFFTGSSYYGRIAPPATVERVMSELRSHQIDFLLIWAERDPQESTALHRELAERFPDATRGELKELSVLDVRGITTRPEAGHQSKDER